MSMLFSLLAAAALPAADCAALKGKHGDVAVETATAIAAGETWKPGEPRYRALTLPVSICRVGGHIEGNIAFELWLPAGWNGRLLGAGVGGDAGYLNYSDMDARVAQGFATVTTDAGHHSSNARWMTDAKARVDYEHRAVHLTALAAKELIARYYGRQVSRSYYLGCSGGGRQALREMQLYPGDYDGVIAGAPGPNMPLQSVRMLWFALEQQRNPAAALREEDWALYERRVHETCDPLDGVKDGVIGNPLSCHFDTATLLCKPGEAEGCLTAPRLAMLNRIIAPLPDENGKPMDGGLFPGVRTRPGPPSPLLRAMWADAVYDDPNWDAMTFKRTADLAAINRIMPNLRSDRVDIEPFMRRGGKAIIYQGWQDPSTNAGPTLDYYWRLAQRFGGYEKLSRSVRLFMVPGMNHCFGGPGANLFGGMFQFPASTDPDRDMVWSLVRWVEQDAAPQRIVAARMEQGKEVFTRPLCPFPQLANWDGTGPQDRASSYTCVVDPVQARYRKPY